MSVITIWHNPRCSKSRATLALLRESGIEPEIRLYLKDPPDEKELRGALKALGMSARDLARRGEAVWKELDLAEADDDTVLAAMCAHPVLIERPVVFVQDKAVIGRPPEAVLKILPERAD